MVTQALIKWRFISVALFALVLLVVSPLTASMQWEQRPAVTPVSALDPAERINREAILPIHNPYQLKVSKTTAALEAQHAATLAALQQRRAQLLAETRHLNTHIAQRHNEEASVARLQARIDSLIRDVRRWEVRVSRAKADYLARQAIIVHRPPTSLSAIKYYAQQRVGAYQFQFLDKLWMKESGWRWNADNPYSDAYGIPQALPGSKMASAGADWATNPYTQIRWGLGYIASVYGTCEAAWAHSVQYNWY